MITQYPQISIKPEKWMNSSKSYWEKKETLELGVDEIIEKAQQKALNIMEILLRLRLCSKKTSTRTAIFTRRYDVHFQENRGNV